MRSRLSCLLWCHYVGGDLSVVRWQTGWSIPCYGACLRGTIKQQSMLMYCRCGQCIMVICISAMRSLGRWSLAGCWCVLKWVFLCNCASASLGLKAAALFLFLSHAHAVILYHDPLVAYLFITVFWQQKWNIYHICVLSRLSYCAVNL